MMQKLSDVKACKRMVLWGLQDARAKVDLSMNSVQKISALTQRNCKYIQGQLAVNYGANPPGSAVHTSAASASEEDDSGGAQCTALPNSSR